MKHAEVNRLYKDLQILIGYCADKKIGNFTLNYGLNRNIKKLEKAVEAINKAINPELLELEQKAFKLLTVINEKIQKENEGKETKEPLKTLMDGIAMLTKAEQKRHAELMIEYNAAMEEENDLELYLIDPAKIEDINIEFAYLTVLSNFLKD